MIEDIPLIPAIPDGLRLAARQGTLIPFVGAGASKLAGCPGWDEFADRALQFFVQAGKFDHSQLEQLKHLNPRVKISVALELQEEHQMNIDFDRILHPLNGPNELDGKRFYAALSKLAKTFVTTNYDKWLDEEIAFPEIRAIEDIDPTITETRKRREVICKVEGFTYDNLKPNTVIHLHGSLTDSPNMVLTTRHYVERYANDRLTEKDGKENRVLTFLENLFRLKTVLFIGYGLEELEILEYAILKARHVHESSSREARHFILQGFFSHERELARHLANYYLRDCGIQLIPFLRDKRNWHQLLDVIEEYASLIPTNDPLVVQELLDMGDLLNG